MESLSDFKRLEQCFSFVSVFPSRPHCLRAGAGAGTLRLVADAGSATGQSQFAANHLAVRDPAMSDEERRQSLSNTGLSPQGERAQAMTGSSVPDGTKHSRLRLRLADGSLILLRWTGEFSASTGSPKNALPCRRSAGAHRKDARPPVLHQGRILGGFP